jgi:hypothetical protein
VRRGPHDPTPFRTRSRVRPALAARVLQLSHNHRMISKRFSERRTFMTARKFAPYPSIYFAYNLDFRGRVYACSDDLSPQGGEGWYKAVQARLLERSIFLGFSAVYGQSRPVRQRGCELPLRGRMRRELCPFHGLFRAQDNHHAPHNSPPNSVSSSAFGAFSPGHDWGVVVSDAHH